MKKRILFVILTVLTLVCLLAISASATSTTDAYGELDTIEGIEAPKNIGADARVVVLGADGVTYYTFPTYYLVSDNTTLTWSPKSEVLELTGLTSKGSGTSIKNYVVRMEVPSNVTTLQAGGNGFERSKSIKEITLTDSVTSIKSYCFNECSNLVDVHGIAEAAKRGALCGAGEVKTFAGCSKLQLGSIELPEGTTVIGSNYFEGTIITEVKIPASVTKIDEKAFKYCYSLATVEIAEGSQLKSIGSYAFEKCIFTSFYLPSTVTAIYGGAFANCKNAEIENFNACELEIIEYQAFLNCRFTENIVINHCTSIGDDAFRGCSLLKTVVINTNISKIGGHAFADDTNLESITLPKSVTTLTIGDYAFEKAGKLTEIILPIGLDTLKDGVFNQCGLKRVVMPHTVTTISNGVFKNCGNMAIIYTGTSADTLINLTNSSNNGAIKNADIEKISYADYDAATHTSKVIVYGFNICDAYYNNEHQNDGNSCVLYCGRCEKSEYLGENAVHVFGEYTIVYEEYIKAGKKISVCQNEGCVHNDEANPVYEDVNPIITLRGYSAKIAGSEVCIGYAVDNDALVEYNTVSENKFSMGVVAYIPDENETDIDPINDDLSLKDAQHTIFAQIATDMNYAGFDFKLRGFGESEYELPLVMCAYVKDDNGVRYICMSKNAEDQYVLGQNEFASTIKYVDMINE